MSIDFTPNILYIDDEESNLRIFKINFKRHYNVFTTTEIKEAREILEKNNIHLIITDQKMPEMTGTEFLKSILPLYPDVLRIVLTGFSDIQDLIQAVNECSIHQYMTKPYDNGEMKLTLDKALESFKLQNDNKDLVKQLQKANEELEAKVIERTNELMLTNQRITDSIRYARKIQRSILSTQQDFSKYFQDSFALYQPKDLVGGDFYASFDKEDRIIIAAGDCTGHGVPGALMSILGSSLLHSIIDYKEEYATEKILNDLRVGVIKTLRQDDNDNKDGMEIGIISYQPASQRLEFASSRLNLVYFQNGEMFELKGDRKSIGGAYDLEHLFENQSIIAEKDTCFYLFSDGLQDQFGGENKKRLGSKKLKEMLLEIHQKPFEEQKQYLENFIKDWIGDDHQIDDIMMLGFKV
ncbi:MAG: response regulator [Raineya sp.]|jgi:serine phosphatase RsbU (regulator of sigma subunit)|nr:response regulator [Raineya sp.]